MKKAIYAIGALFLAAAVIIGCRVSGIFMGGGRGDGAIGSEAFTEPRGITVAANGAVLIADKGHAIRRLLPGGTVERIAGTYIKGNSGNLGPAINAQISDPIDVATDASGDLYFSDDAGIHAVEHGNIRLVVDCPKAIFGIYDTSEWLYAAFPSAVGSGIRVKRWRIPFVGTATCDGEVIAGSGSTGFSGDGGPATAASLSVPSDVVVPATGAVYIADTGNNRIRRVDPITSLITTVAGGGMQLGDGGPALAARLFLPQSVAVGTFGDIYIADFANHRVRHVARDGMIETLLGTGLRQDVNAWIEDKDPAKQPISSPFGVALSLDEQIVYASSELDRVVRFVKDNPTPVPTSTETATPTS